VKVPVTSYRSEKCTVRSSPVHGLGLFATEPICAGEVVAIRSGHIVGKERALQLDAELGGYSHPITDEFFLTPINEDEVSDIVIFFNHGCEPNLVPLGQIVFVALKDIGGGDEILCDYGTIVAYEEYELQCLCGSSNCRGTVKGNDWRNPELQARYSGHFSTQIEQKIKAEEWRR
jgi:SET domain-containing protein